LTKEYLQLEKKYGVGECGKIDCETKRLLCFVIGGHHMTLTRAMLKVWAQSIITGQASLESPPNLPIFDYKSKTPARPQQQQQQQFQQPLFYNQQAPNFPSQFNQQELSSNTSFSINTIIITGDGVEKDRGALFYTRTDTFASLFAKTLADLKDKELMVWVEKEGIEGRKVCGAGDRVFDIVGEAGETAKVIFKGIAQENRLEM
jgi:hypothetical protein